MTADRPPLAEGVPDRLYGRRRGHALRDRQQRLIDETLPRLRLLPDQAADARAAFGMPDAPLWFEVGFGGGEHTFEQFNRHPGVAYIASEVFENGLCSLLTRLVPEGAEGTAPLPGNLRLWPQDARHLLGLMPDRSLDRLMLMFPDPWPKARHAKRRFVHPAMLAEVHRVLKPGGEWRIASDDPTYQAWVTETFADTPLFAQAERHDTHPEGWPATRYEAKAMRAGRKPIWWIFVAR